jgi:hypothetical protein
VTVEDSTCLDPVSRISGSRRYPFTISGQLRLVQRCFARNGRHDFAQGSLSPGPNVFLDCASEKSHSDTGPHHRWAAGPLYDNVRVPEGLILLSEQVIKSASGSCPLDRRANRSFCSPKTPD